MECAIFQGNSRIDIMERPDPVPGPGEVLVRVKASAICGSELHSYRDAEGIDGNGGHEAMGIVDAIGEGVTQVAVGDRVGCSAVAGCGKADCPYCEKGQSTWCPDRTGHGSAHAELYLTRETACLPLPDDVPDGPGVLLTGDGMGVPYHSSQKIADPDLTRIAIFGMGPIGLGNLMVQHWLGRECLCVDISPWRLDYAAKLGAVAVVNARNVDPVAAVQEWTDGFGADVAIEAAGRPETLRQCFAAVRPGGTVLMNGEQSPLELSPSEDFIRRDITAVGSWFFQVRESRAMISMYHRGMPVDQLISHTFNFTDIAAAFRAFAAAETAKVVLRYD